MRFEKRDEAILLAIQKYGGVLARSHIKAMFWPDATERAMHERLSILHENAYIDWPNEEQRRSKAGPKSVCWLGWKGIQFIAGQSGIGVEADNPGESQRRQLQSELRGFGIPWLREPNWSKLDHDLRVVDFWLRVDKAVYASPDFILETWISERQFRSTPDQIEFTLRGVRQTRRIIPDGYFVVVDSLRKVRARHLLELDMATEDNPRFETEKIAAGLAYLLSPQYKERFGGNTGRWLTVTTGVVRMKHLMEKAAQAARDATNVFLFTTFQMTQEASPLTSPIWYQVGDSEPHPLFGP